MAITSYCYHRALYFIIMKTLLLFFRGRASLQIFKTSLESLSLESLEEISFGHIYIANNSRLCYANGIKWEKLRQNNQTAGQKIIVEFNRNATSCGK